MIERHLLKLRARDTVSAEEEQAIRDALGEVRNYAADQTVIRQGEQLEACTLLLDGMMCRYKDLSDGQRQITELHVAGDFVDLHSFTLKHLDHNVLTLTPCRVVMMPHERLERITEQHPHLTRLYWFSTTLDAAIHREWELSLGRRSAIAKLASLFCEMRVRLEVVGLSDEDGYALPLTQADLAECLGLTPIHVNRTLKELRDQGIVQFKSGRVTIQDQARMEQIGEFDPDYLYLEHRRH
ncbi:Crp/Fnr family transcriptional regulator [Sphingomonas crusticola]|uniref:Crp/Fnr family transcriptional regulator n=1 Tax=Sphingomonas crusticola TaxID=1697973 RepID=UPI000E248C5C|nr:Crp/Fnr family transcriptional regulator [Sphingomonas crusticola]